VIHPNGHNDNGNAAVIQELEENEARNNDLPLSPDANVPIPELATRAKQRARQQIRQNRFVIIGAGAVVIALLIFVATSMPHRGAPQKAKSLAPLLAVPLSKAESSVDRSNHTRLQH
jgi:hypothetical protein